MQPVDMDLNACIELESKVWDALRRGDAEADARMLAADFLGVYPTGFADRTAHTGQLANGPTVSKFQLLEARLMVLSDNNVLLSYRADWHRFGSPDSDAGESMYISSLWSQRSGQWLNVFSQDSPAEISDERAQPK
jgi:hypothetical protein